jgi:hypothetical protein
MGKTIIQTIGPLYGEVVNGTVFGRPNGSIYVPSSNTIVAELVETFRFLFNSAADAVTVCNSTGTAAYYEKDKIQLVAQSQDIQNYMAVEIAKDSDFTDMIAERNLTAGQFNTNVSRIPSTESVENETTYYLRCVLYSSNGVAVATSNVIEVVGVAE